MKALKGDVDSFILVGILIFQMKRKPTTPLYPAAALMQLNNSGSNLANHIRIPAHCASERFLGLEISETTSPGFSSLFLPNKRSSKNPKQNRKAETQTLTSLYCMKVVFKVSSDLKMAQSRYTERIKC